MGKGYIKWQEDKWSSARWKAKKREDRLGQHQGSKGKWHVRVWKRSPPTFWAPAVGGSVLLVTQSNTYKINATVGVFSSIFPSRKLREILRECPLPSVIISNNGEMMSCSCHFHYVRTTCWKLTLYQALSPARWWPWGGRHRGMPSRLWLEDP